jgi:hypothetical protein
MDRKSAHEELRQIQPSTTTIFIIQTEKIEQVKQRQWNRGVLLAVAFPLSEA